MKSIIIAITVLSISGSAFAGTWHDDMADRQLREQQYEQQRQRVQQQRQQEIRGIRQRMQQEQYQGQQRQKRWGDNHYSY